MHPVYEIPPPIGFAPSTRPSEQIIPPPIGSEPETLVNSHPVTPQIGSYNGSFPLPPEHPPIGASPVMMIPSVSIQPPIGGPQQQQGYLSTNS
jgi:hypothetical protein